MRNISSVKYHEVQFHIFHSFSFLSLLSTLRFLFAFERYAFSPAEYRQASLDRTTSGMHLGHCERGKVDRGAIVEHTKKKASSGFRTTSEYLLFTRSACDNSGQCGRSSDWALAACTVTMLLGKASDLSVSSVSLLDLDVQVSLTPQSRQTSCAGLLQGFRGTWKWKPWKEWPGGWAAQFASSKLRLRLSRGMGGFCRCLTRKTVQEAGRESVRLRRDGVGNPGGWLSTIAAGAGGVY
jgi:hypothetical protein